MNLIHVQTWHFETQWNSNLMKKELDQALVIKIFNVWRPPAHLFKSLELSTSWAYIKGSSISIFWWSTPHPSTIHLWWEERSFLLPSIMKINELDTVYENQCCQLWLLITRKWINFQNSIFSNFGEFIIFDPMWNCPIILFKLATLSDYL